MVGGFDVSGHRFVTEITHLMGVPPLHIFGLIKPDWWLWPAASSIISILSYFEAMPNDNQGVLR
jgi:hypothetical protein